MSMRVNTFVTHLRPEDAYVIIEFIDQLRDALMQNYGDDIRVFLQDVLPVPVPWPEEEDGEQF